MVNVLVCLLDLIGECVCVCVMSMCVSVCYVSNLKF